jgi:hypothetical protein
MIILLLVLLLSYAPFIIHWSPLFQIAVYIRFDLCLILFTETVNGDHVLQQADTYFAGDTSDLKPVEDLADDGIGNNHILDCFIAEVVPEFHIFLLTLYVFSLPQWREKDYDLGQKKEVYGRK